MILESRFAPSEPIYRTRGILTICQIQSIAFLHCIQVGSGALRSQSAKHLACTLAEQQHIRTSGSSSRQTIHVSVAGLLASARAAAMSPAIACAHMVLHSSTAWAKFNSTNRSTATGSCSSKLVCSKSLNLTGASGTTKGRRTRHSNIQFSSKMGMLSSIGTEIESNVAVNMIVADASCRANEVKCEKNHISYMSVKMTFLRTASDQYT